MPLIYMNDAEIEAIAIRPCFILCRNLQGQTGLLNTCIGVLPEWLNNGGSASLASFGNPLKPAMPKSALPMR
jgi:hypothetical protein